MLCLWYLHWVRHCPTVQIDMFKLIPPTIEYGESFLTQMRCKVAAGLHPPGDNAVRNLDDQIARWRKLAQDNENGRYEYWLIHDEEYIGTFQLRRAASGISDEMASHIYWQIDNQNYQDASTLNTLFELGIEAAKAHEFTSLIFVISEADTVRAKILDGHGCVQVGVVVSLGDEQRLARYHLDIV